MVTKPNRIAELKANLSSKESFDGKNILEIFFEEPHHNRIERQHKWDFSYPIKNISIIHNGKDLLKEAELSGRLDERKQFAEWLDELTESGVNGDARRLVERKIHSLSEDGADDK